MARFGGNRFGGGGGGNSLQNLMLRNELMSQLRKKQQQPAQPAQAAAQASQQGAGFTVKPSVMSTGSQPTAAESAAFNQRSRDRAVYGDRWNRHMKHSRTGLKEKEITALGQKNVATAAKEAAEFQLKKGTLAEKIRANKAKEAAGPLGTGMPGAQKPTAKTTSGSPMGTPVATPAVQPQAPTGQPQSGYASATDANGNVIRVDGNGRMTKLPAVAGAPAPGVPAIAPQVIGNPQAVTKNPVTGNPTPNPLKYRKPKSQGPASTNNLLELGEYLKKVLGRTPM
jgi:hypothetical protein